MEPSTIRALELAKESSDRARSVLHFTQVACIIVFMAAWHELPSSWTFSRLTTARAAAWYFECGAGAHPEIASGAGASVSSAAELMAQHENCHYLKDTPGNPDTNAPFSPKEIEAGKEFVAKWNMTPGQLKRHLDNLEDSFVSRTMNVTAPLGFSFDLNDLGLIGGLSFLFLMMWLYFSLRREEDNVRLLFDGVESGLKKEVYKLACMTQVLTIPPEQKEEKAPKWRLLFGWIPKVILRFALLLLDVTPFAVQTFVLWNDRKTWKNGAIINSDFATGEFVLGCVLSTLLCLFTVLCIYRSNKVDKRWAAAHPMR